MITVKCFAQVREVAGEGQTVIPAQPDMTMQAVVDYLSAQDGKWAQALSDGVLMACNHVLVDGEHPVSDGDEVAFFPPVTGG
ncbi:molybdopterin synthase sulfur carrier subunit [Alteromonas pelagimontana]|uniref:Molybdopterin synthase sulfur carrier subunit n=1 Tax=Alteromonas pelagimontana TaxID=1858656 RepID=A0A6M4MGM2_9ALTE|nr:MoaD/ThiS family protein [Alteromonas pelagimontana]QJR82341.1 molybdopterin synthase sulfur carrier subunit [Alteromonas pelagimontana]